MLNFIQKVSRCQPRCNSTIKFILVEPRYFQSSVLRKFELYRMSIITGKSLNTNFYGNCTNSFAFNKKKKKLLL